MQQSKASPLTAAIDRRMLMAMIDPMLRQGSFTTSRAADAATASSARGESLTSLSLHQPTSIGPDRCRGQTDV